MRQSMAGRKLIGFLFVSVTGTLLHFLYDFSGKSLAAALISAVNESIWEHMKLIFYPMVLYTLWENRRFQEDRAAARFSGLCGILMALIMIPVLYYTYTGMLGISADWFNITIFFVAAGSAYYLQYRLEKSGACQTGPVLWATVIVIIAAAFTAATFVPPRIPLFRDPLTGTYGILAIG